MIIVSDTTPLITLLKIDRIDLLEKLFGSVKIPPSVYNELSSNKIFKNEALIIKNVSYINLLPIKNKDKVESIMEKYSLDIGESEAIALALENNAEAILMDEKKGREASISLNIKAIGTIGILSLSYELGYFSKEDMLAYINILKSANRFLSESLYRSLLDKL